ncbi:MAG: AraC family transcriptional regulator [Opitutaceae bacterium]
MKPLAQPLREDVPLIGPVSVTFRRFDLPAFTYPWHFHPEVELTWILEGNGLRHVGDSIRPFDAGDCCLLGANLPHTWLSSRTTSTPRARSFVVQFDPKRFDDLLRLPEYSRVAQLLRKASCGLRFEPDLGRRLLRRLRSRAKALSRLSMLWEILDTLANCADVESISTRSWPDGRSVERDPSLSRVLAILSEQEGGHITQADVAASIGMTPSAFSRFFRRAMGRSFQDYATGLRLGLACRQLLDTDLNVSEIAFASGFGNLSNFNRAFRIRHGMTPSEFRRESLDRDGQRRQFRRVTNRTWL